jgi:hypothetical protein
MGDSEENSGNYRVTTNSHADSCVYTYDSHVEAESEDALQKLKAKIGGQQSVQPGELPGRSVMDKKLLFISHAESDEEIANKLVDLVLAALDLNEDEVRCTSVPGHKLSVGESISLQLKTDIHISAVIIALITEKSLQSKWVLFELGSSWALDKMIIPILKRGLTEKDLPGPLSESCCIKVDSKDASCDLAGAFKRASLELNVFEKTGAKRQKKLEEFLEAFKSYKLASPHVVTNDAIARGDLYLALEAYFDQKSNIMGDRGQDNQLYINAEKEQIEAILRRYFESIDEI